MSISTIDAIDEDGVRMSLAGVDLNLLVALDALLTECHVTRAAERTSVGQPAMSAALGRLRRHFNDPLLVKEGRRLVPTPLAESLVGPVNDAIAAVGAVMGSTKSFDPSADHRTFTLIASDYVVLILLRPLFAQLAVLAPRVRFNLLPLQPDFVEQLRRGQADLLIAPDAVVGQVSLESSVLFTERFLLACDRDNPDVGDKMTAEDLGHLRYLSYSLGPLHGLAEVELDEIGIDRQIEFRTQNFVMAPFLLTGTRLVSMVQERLARQFVEQAHLRLVESPVAMRPIVEAMYWNPRHTEDPAHSWFRCRIAEMAATL